MPSQILTEVIKSCFCIARPSFSLGIALIQAPAWIDESGLTSDAANVSQE